MPSSIVATLLVVGAAPNTALADDLWTYTYRGIEVTTAEGSTYTEALAHDLARFDTALTRILQLPERRVPTHVYELPGEPLKAITGQSEGASYKFTGYEVTVVTDHTKDPRYWGALFGYTGSLVVNGRALRAPYWFVLGVPEVFAVSEFDSGRVKTGAMSAGYSVKLVHTRLIPMRTFLRMQKNDPQLASADFHQLFSAQSWYLVREIFIEGKLRDEFGRYLGLLRDGKREEDAFAASFKVSYEDLDKVLQAALSDPTHMYVLPVPRETGDGQHPRQLSGPEIKARLAELSLLWGHRAEASHLATQALQGDPDGELALRVLARASLLEDRPAEARTSVDRLLTRVAPSAAGLTDGAEVLAHLARASSKQDPSGGDAPGLWKRSEQAYEQALTLDPEYLRAWAGLAYLYGAERDGAAAAKLVARAQPVMEKHLENGALARALATMSAETGQTSAAFLFGEFWRTNALTQYDLDEAQAFMARLHGK